jgi:hypothetical protein
MGLPPGFCIGSQSVAFDECASKHCAATNSIKKPAGISTDRVSGATGSELKLTNGANVASGDGNADAVHNKRKRHNNSGATSIGPTRYKPSG